METEPAISWWVPYTIKKRDRIIASINYRVTKQDHNFGINIPKDIKEALKLDQDNRNTLWQDAYKKEMFQVGAAFKILRDDDHIPDEYKKYRGHIKWLVNMDFTWKAWWVKDGHLKPDLKDSKYAGVVARESVRIALTYDNLQETEVIAAYIRKAYLQFPTPEKN